MVTRGAPAAGGAHEFTAPSSGRIRVTVTPLLGGAPSGLLAAAGAASGAAYATLLDIDGVRLLLDCGLSATLSPIELEPLRAIAPTLDGVLISQPDVAHAGGLPLL
jgi:hypothetical protein